MGTCRTEGVLKRIPAPLRAIAVIAWVVVGVFAEWQRAHDNHVSPWVWIVIGPGLVVGAALALVHFPSFTAPDRDRFEPWMPRWPGLFVLIGSGVGFGVWSFVDGDPQTKPYVGVGMILFASVLVALFVRHLLKPVRPEPPQPDALAEWIRGGARETPPMEARWYASSQDGNDRSGQDDEIGQSEEDGKRGAV